ncbi:MAG: cyclic nucleotide-binding domain-containing protein [Dactylosporangium sp.]|nr:cyclic nucleotide-binding domain-containing protein [Dactylosporangium sp.]NNJ60844.1 cyclic nucleotide-binding domain-containing protein [Dactylosporangium sp.]
MIEIRGTTDGESRASASRGSHSFERASDAGSTLVQRRWEYPAQRSFWHSLDATERKAFAAAAREQAFGGGTTLCWQDDTTTDVIMIESGWTKVTVAAEGRERIIAVRGPGDTIGERAALVKTGRSATVVALENVQALVVTADRFHELLIEHPHILEVLKRQEYERQAEDLGGVPHGESVGKERRLASLLLEFALRRGGYERDGAVTITLPMSCTELADWVDAPDEAVDRYLNSWQQRGVVHVAQRHVTVVDAAGLEKIYRTPAGDLASQRSDQALSSLPGTMPLNHSIFFTDIAAFGDPSRDDDDRRVVHNALYTMLRESFEGSNVPWQRCIHEDRGDGILTVVPPTVSTVSLVEPLIALLAARLRRHNRRAGSPVRIQLRAALHVGPVRVDHTGLSGHSLIHTARLLDAPVLKRALATMEADLAFIASDHVYDTVIKHAGGFVDPAAYQRLKVQAKRNESPIAGWMSLAGGSGAMSRLPEARQEAC